MLDYQTIGLKIFNYNNVILGNTERDIETYNTQ